MSDDSTSQLQPLIDRLCQGDESARRQLLERALGRMRLLTAAMVGRWFPRLQGRHDVDSILHDAWLRLLQALEKVQPPTVADFFGLAAHKIRQVLLDVAEHQRRRLEREGARLGDPSSAKHPEPANDSFDPARLALWTEFHEQVAALPQDQRTVFEFHHYLGLSQAEIARVLDLHPRKVSYLWVAATQRLGAQLDGLKGLLS